MARSTLSRQAYLDATLKLVAKDGVEKLSLRKLAASLGVTAMAVYKHFDDKEELLSAALDEFIARADVIPDDALNWDDWLSELGRGMYNTLCDEPSWIPQLGSIKLGQKASAVTEVCVARLSAAGFSPNTATKAYFAVIQVAIGAACLSVSSQQDNEHPLKIEQIDAGLPLVVQALQEKLAPN